MNIPTTSLLFNPEQEAEKIISFIKDTSVSAGFSQVVIGVSGGIDSAVSLALSSRALGSTHVFPYLLPYGQFNPQGVADAQLAIEACQIPKDQVTVSDIAPMVHSFHVIDAHMDEVRMGNIMARCRMIVLFDAAKKRNALVMGTENKSEHYLGYYTRFGDEASDIEPLRHVLKTDVYRLADYLQIPESIRTKAPSAGLWEGQSDEQEFGVSYEAIDEVIRLIEAGTKVEDLLANESNKKIINLFDKVAYKHKVPYMIAKR